MTEEKGRLDSLLESSAEKYRILTVKVSNDVADDLKNKAKKLGMSRTKLVHEMFFDSYDRIQKRLQTNG